MAWPSFNQFISDHCSLKSLQLQPRLDPFHEKQYNQELGSYLFFNFPMLEIVEYCAKFKELCEERLKKRLIPRKIAQA